MSVVGSPSAPIPDSARPFVLDDFGVRAGDTWATQRISMTLNPGELGYIVGPLGSGKSLLAEALARFQRPSVQTFGRAEWQTTGEARLARATPAPAPRVGFVPQDPRLAALPTDRVGALLVAAWASAESSSSGASRARSRADRLREAEPLLERLRLAPDRILGLEFRELSSSERHRVLLALAVAEKNPLLVYDGIAEGLDPDDRRHVAELLRDVLAEGRIVLATTRQLGGLDIPIASTVHLEEAEPKPGPLPLLRRTDAVAQAPSHEQALLEVMRLRVARGKRKIFGGKRQAYPVDGASLFVRHSETLVLFGAAGSGKTTLLEALAGLLRPQAGRVLLHGRDVAGAHGEGADRLRRQVQLVFQDASSILDARHTVRELFEQARRLAQKPVGWRRKRLQITTSPGEWLELLGLSPHLLDLRADDLSSGEAQRVDLGRSLVLEPQLVLLDSPRVSGVDTDGGALAALILGKKREGKSFLVATNEPAMAESLGDRVAVLHAGRVIELGTASAVMKEPGHPATLALLRGSLGAPPDPRHPLRGCPFVDSCPRRVLPQCDEQEPSLAPHPGRPPERGHHRVACFHPLP